VTVALIVIIVTSLIEVTVLGSIVYLMYKTNAADALPPRGASLKRFSRR
jgi:hypothetical protein